MLTRIDNVTYPPPTPYLTTLVLRGAAVGASRDADEVDAVAVAAPVRQVVAQVRARGGDGLAVAQAPHVLPHHLVVAEARPTVVRALPLTPK